MTSYRRSFAFFVVVLLLCAGSLRAQEAAKPIDVSPHTVRFVEVEQDVKLEVLDWGGTGRPLVLLTGFIDNAHVFDKFAPKLTGKYHVYGISRRGFGASSAPVPTDHNYSADRLGDDVLAVIDALKLDRPILVGHSLGGQELSSVGSRHPEKVAGLIYLDAGYSYAFFDRAHGDHAPTDSGYMIYDALDLRQELNLILKAAVTDPTQLLPEMRASVAQYGSDLEDLQKRMALMPARSGKPGAPAPPPIFLAITLGRQKYTEIHVPVLAIFADPHDFGSLYKADPAARAAVVEDDRARTTSQANAFAAGVPSAHVVRIANADHYIFKSNEADVLREMDAFLATLP